jgi:hypothetical protein
VVQQICICTQQTLLKDCKSRACLHQSDMSLRRRIHVRTRISPKLWNSIVHTSSQKQAIWPTVISIKFSFLNSVRSRTISLRRILIFPSAPKSRVSKLSSTLSCLPHFVHGTHGMIVDQSSIPRKCHHFQIFPPYPMGNGSLKSGVKWPECETNS